MLDPLHSLHELLTRWCSQMLDPLHSLHLLLRRRCSQMLDPLHSLHVPFWRMCSQMPDPLHSLQRLLWRRCWQKLDPPHSLHRCLWRWWTHMLASRISTFLLSFGRFPIAASPTCVSVRADFRHLACTKPPGKVGCDGFNFCRIPFTRSPILLT